MNSILALSTLRFIPGIFSDIDVSVKHRKPDFLAVDGPNVASVGASVVASITTSVASVTTSVASVTTGVASITTGVARAWNVVATSEASVATGVARVVASTRAVVANIAASVASGIGKRVVAGGRPAVAAGVAGRRPAVAVAGGGTGVVAAGGTGLQVGLHRPFNLPYTFSFLFNNWLFLAAFYASSILQICHILQKL